MKTNTDLLLIFTRNPELGKCKTRLAAKVGNEAALDIYSFLLNHTVSITENLKVDKQVWYSEAIWEDDVWNNDTYKKERQEGKDLGERMNHAFEEGFKSGYERIIIIGSDMHDLAQNDLEQAFAMLHQHDFVVGPAEDGGYYLLGMTKLHPSVFKDKSWGKETVLKATLTNLTQENYALLPTKNDIDHYEDIQHIDAFQPYLKHMQQ